MRELKLAELHRLLENLIQYATVAEVDLAAARVKVTARGQLLTAWLPWLTRRAGTDSDWWAPDVGERVLLLCPGGDPALGAVLPAFYHTDVPAPANAADLRTVHFSDGAVLEYDRAAHALRVALPAGATVELVSDGGVTITGDVAVDGDITATGDVSDSAGALSRLRSNYNAHKHVGNMGSPTSPPDAQDA